MHTHVIAGSFEPLDFAEWQEKDAPGITHDQTIGRGTLWYVREEIAEAVLKLIRIARTVVPPDAIHGRGEPFAIERLEQIIDGIHFEGADRELVVRGYEYHDRQALERKRFQHLKAVQLGHLNIEEYSIRHMRFDDSHRFTTRCRFTNDLDIGLHAEQPDDALSRDRLIIDDDDPDHCGILTSAQTPPSARSARRRRPGRPYVCSSRARVFARPIPEACSMLQPCARPGPLSQTDSSMLPDSLLALTTMCPSRVRFAMPWRMAFSTSGWRIKCGTSTSRSSSSMR